MLDFFTIFTKGGILLWYFKGVGILQKEWENLTPAVNTFIKTVLLQERTGKNRTVAFESGSLALKYRLDNEFELVFVAAFQKMLPLLYLDKLLDEIQLRFRDQFSRELMEKAFFGEGTFYSFNVEFERTLKRVEANCKAREIEKRSEMRSFEESSKSRKTVASLMESSGTVAKANNNNDVGGKRKGNNKAYDNASPGGDPAAVAAVAVAAACETASSTNLGEGDFDEKTRLDNLNRLASKVGKKGAKAKSPKAPKKGKADTKWDVFTFGGKGPSAEEARTLDRSQKSEDDSVDNQLSQFLPDRSVVGKSANLGVIDEDPTDQDVDEFTLKTNQGSSGLGIWSSLSSLVGSKQLTMDDIAPAISKMSDHLISKNVAADVAQNLCDSVSNKLRGKACGTFQTVHRTVKDALTESLIQLLTPRRRIDIVRDVFEARKNSRPFVITFCGVNGVGKSTNLAKICFWLVENKFRVLIAACDTFRAGAVEQLRTHSRRLNSFYPSANQPGGKPVVELYEKGYGKDAAGIALEAISYARQAKIDVVLVDTAGRMQDNEPLMRSLTKLISVNDPDLVLFVGEALVGNEAVDQLVKFNKALADHSPSQSNPHLIDGIVLTKFDTIDDKVGSSISMTYTTGQPIVFVGTGQTYTDLKSLNARAVVQALMK